MTMAVELISDVEMVASSARVDYTALGEPGGGRAEMFRDWLNAPSENSQVQATTSMQNVVENAVRGLQGISDEMRSVLSEVETLSRGGGTLKTEDLFRIQFACMRWTVEAEMMSAVAKKAGTTVDKLTQQT